MKRNKRFCRAIAALLATLLLLGTAVPALASEEEPGTAASDSGTIAVGSAEDLLALAHNCTLDTWSRDKTVVLTADISLAGVDFSGIPTFGGTFDGGGHTISGLSIGESISPAGLFGMVQKGAVIKNLKVRGSATPSGDADTLGGIAGINYGKLVNCSFQGFVNGSSTVGGIAGQNEGTGQLINCSFAGVVTGEHYVGGIAGQNTGSLIQCVNTGSINTTEIDVKTDLQNLSLDLSQLNSTENVPAGTDIGGIAGFSTGLVQSCRNDGDVGYEHMGYNVGGIVGRQSGYLDGCVNNGIIRGRKDVGGIAGQMEPQVTLKYSEDTLSSLWDELDVLEDLMDQALGDAEHAADAVSSNMDRLTVSVGTAKDTASDLTDAMTDWANGNIDQVNDASARMSWVLNQMDPILDDLGDALDQAETAAGQFSDALDEAGAAGDLGNEAVAELRLALEDLKTASGHGRDAYAHFKTAMAHLKSSLGEEAATEKTLRELAGAAVDLAKAFSDIAGAGGGIKAALESDPRLQALRQGTNALEKALAEISDGLRQTGGALDAIARAGATEENLKLLSSAVGTMAKKAADLDSAYQTFSTALNTLLEAYRGGESGEEAIQKVMRSFEELVRADEEIAAAQKDLSQIVENVKSDGDFQPASEQLEAGLADLNRGIADAEAAIDQIGAALMDMAKAGVPKETIEAIQQELEVIAKTLPKVKDAAERIGQALNKLVKNFDVSEAEQAWPELKSAAADLEEAAGSLDEAVDHMAKTMELMEDAGAHGSEAMEYMKEVSGTMEKAIALMSRAMERTGDVVEELAEKPAIQFTPVESGLTERGDALDDALSQMLDQVNSLNDTMSSSADILLADLRAINRQVGVIIDLLRKNSEEEKKDEERFEDISDQELDNDRTSGRISASRNTGTVEGDVNVAGIVGSLAIEYDFDPEDDLTEDGDRSLDFRYQTVAVVTESVNEGTVTAKKNYAGGIVGRMDLGTAYLCQGYGGVESTGGDYVGGIAGLSRSTIRRCFAKCTLSGGSYIGGVVGAGDEDSVVENCYTLVRITDYKQYAGAISGAEDGEFAGNCFVSDELAGLGRVSCAGKAEPISYQTLLRVGGLPDAFRSFTLTFTADDTVLKTESFDFGASFDGDIYPDIPEKEEHYAQWDIPELSDLRFDTVVEAVYTPYITALSSGETRDDGRQVFYVEGSFQSGDAMEALRAEADTSGFEEVPATYFQRMELTELWHVRFSDDGRDAHTLRYLRPEDEGRLRIYVRQNGVWERVRGEEIGRYLAFETEGTELEIAVFSAYIAWWLWTLLALLCLLLGFCVVRNLRKRNKSRRKKEERRT